LGVLPEGPPFSSSPPGARAATKAARFSFLSSLADFSLLPAAAASLPLGSDLVGLAGLPDLGFEDSPFVLALVLAAEIDGFIP
jgi:hypothetical protein